MKKLIAILSIGFIVRTFVIISYGNLQSDYYWEYGEIAKNIIHGNGYSLFYFDGPKVDYHYNKNVTPYKSAYMPPGYVIFLLPFMFIKNIAMRNLLILFTQSLISIASIFFLYKLCLKLFSESIAIIAAVIASFTPEFAYAILSYTPTVIYHFLILFLLILILSTNKRLKNSVFIGILISIIIYFRAEFILFGLIIIGAFLLKRRFKESIIISCIIITLMLPWGIRNYFTFHKFIPLTTSLGLNLYRGNNPNNIGDWGDESINEKIITNKNDYFEINMNHIYEKAASSYISSHPKNVVINAGKKIISLWIMNLKDKRIMNIFYIIPSIIILLFFIYGLLKSFSWNKFKFLYLFFIYSTFIVIIFFPLQRYQTMMKIVMIPYCAYGISRIFYKKEVFSSFLNI